MKNILKNIKINHFLNSILIKQFTPSNKKIFRENRNSSCLMIKTEGLTLYYADGIEYKCDNNHVVFIPKGTDYYFVVKEHGFCYQINFNTIEKISFLHSFEISNPEIIQLFLNSAISYNEDPANVTKQLAYIYEIFVKILSELDSGNDYFSRAAKIIQREISNPKLDNVYIANKINISEVYLRKLFIKNIGISPRQYIIKVRMERAVALLFNNYSIKEIAQQVGYESVYSFSRSFKDYYNVSPQKYFKQHL